MGPFFALGDALGLPPWLVHRLWLGALLALAAWGDVRLIDALAGRPRGAAHVVAGLLYLLNPYVVVFTAARRVTLLGYAALPWLLLSVHRGLRAPRGWWWPAAFALVVTLHRRRRQRGRDRRGCCSGRCCSRCTSGSGRRRRGARCAPSAGGRRC